jgi:pyrophosphatase PpaX
MKIMLLDLDGTVVDTHELIFRCYDRTMRDHCSCRGSRKIIKKCAGLHLRDIFTATLEHFGVPTSSQLLAEAIAIYRDHLRANEALVSTFPGMKETLCELVRHGWRLAIVTTKPSDAAYRHLHSQELANLFEVVIAGDQCVNLKPHPEPFRKALEAFGAGPDEAVGVGDSEHDVVGARAAGLMTVGAFWGTISREKLRATNPDVLAEHPQGLLNL